MTRAAPGHVLEDGAVDDLEEPAEHQSLGEAEAGGTEPTLVEGVGGCVWKWHQASQAPGGGSGRGYPGGGASPPPALHGGDCL